jgi:phosphohistidine phosphatase
MKTLILIRHGKSSWEKPTTDKERPLIERGILDIQNIATKFKNNLPQHFSIWSSDAKRAASTANLFAQEINFNSEKIEFKTELYTFNHTELENIIKTCPNSVENLILFGHNNALTDFVNKFADSYIENVPTSGLVQIGFDVDHWQNILKGKILKVIFPKDLR